MDLSCPVSENYAAIAKQLHKTALEAEEKIRGFEYLLRSAVNRPTYIQTSTNTITGIVSSLETSFGSRFNPSDYAVTFDNTMMSSLGEGVESDSAAAVLGEGMYEFGVYANAIASGAVNDNSWRAFRIQQQRPNLSSVSGFDLIDSAAYTQFESNTGIGTDCCLVAHFRMRSEDQVRFTLFHENALSTMNISIGAVIWLHKLSELSTVKVS